MNSALFIIFAFLLLSIYLGIRSTKGKKMSMEQWAVGGRGFGSLFVFLLMAGEIYTTFTFLGASSWAYGKGGPAMYVIMYMSLAYVLGYFVLPMIWKYAKEKNLVSSSDFYESKYKSSFMGVLVAIVGVISIIPYFVLQLKGLGIIVSEASYGTISSGAAIWIGAIAVTVYVMISGIHGSAWTAVIKDFLILGIVVFIGLYIPYHYYGGLGEMFKAVDAAKPGFLAIPEKGLSMSWLISTVLMTVFGFHMWPHAFGGVASARSAKALRKNTVISPIYSLVLLFVFFVGYTAIGQVQGLKGPAADLALLKIATMTFDPWFVGLIGAAGLLAALVPGSMLLMAASTLIAKNVYKTVVPTATDKQVMSLAKYLVPVFALISIYFTFNGGSTIVTLLLMAYSFVTQLAPALYFSLMKNNFVNKYGAGAGMIVGVVSVAYVTATNITMPQLFPSLPQWIQDLNIGVIALLLNIIVTIIVSLVTGKSAATSLGNNEIAKLPNN
ncbi:sodium:solute symporter family protein [Paenibacillus sp. LMG 31460]|uniref:Sodium:solute symporter family protein n=1 Tax=Paenibacillus germinis TaxID=2654979 RepID=A0ABX1Z5S5_9BACL|nr:sodium:solute symporter [Paenibacillus germinis]NOU88512.1 sodium:solute symporter family protein [Paenibacillus germinis]